jgi:hypothetical protein
MFSDNRRYNIPFSDLRVATRGQRERDGQKVAGFCKLFFQISQNYVPLCVNANIFTGRLVLTMDDRLCYDFCVMKVYNVIL